jgi:hypothetical protein
MIDITIKYTESLIYIGYLLFILIFAYYNAWQWKDEQDGVYDPKKAKPKWKTAGVFVRYIPFLFIYLPSIEWQSIVFLLCLSMPLFDMGINLFAGKHLFYLGTTSKTDKIGKLKWILYLVFIIISLILLIFTK